ncbi:Tat pathway signal sequence domain protein [Pelagicoccus albus]|uniref:Tat pathway signal sequence domain protein n=1 Tax=Pelagicoccus albus TaxID=415222 RepID=A0A7X1B6G9_9BACT|nr:Tat pathway signal sequence domain protein [Pelagicoccus albus]MBC2606492.1 Tat pathway signal sequence domain protein [Pelagicoccus albus]
MKKSVTRRNFVKLAGLSAAAMPALGNAKGVVDRLLAKEEYKLSPGVVRISWLEKERVGNHFGTAFGVPWPRGQVQHESEFSLRTAEGRVFPLQTWSTAMWDDGSLKWTGHALPAGLPKSKFYEVVSGKSAKVDSPIVVSRSGSAILVDTGLIKAEIPSEGSNLVSKVWRNGRLSLVDGCLVGSRSESPEPGAGVESFNSELKSVEIEQEGPIRCVLKLEGMHREESGREWLPFTLRLYFFSGSDEIKVSHTFVFDGDENEDFLSGLGLRFSVPMTDQLYDRHVRFSGDGEGLWSEAVLGITGLRRQAPDEIMNAQIDGKPLPDIRTWPEIVSSRLHWVPTWGDFSLFQPNSNGFSLRKRTKAGHAWINADQGKRSQGFGYVGGVSGGVAFGMRDFWKLHPTQLDVRNANTDMSEVTLWIYSPQAGPMDLRFYHDGLGMEMEGVVPGVGFEGVEPSMPETAYAKQLDGVNITYEDYEPGFGTPHGVARSSDFQLKITSAVPERKDCAAWAQESFTPPQLVPYPEEIYKARVFGTMWGLPNPTSVNLKMVEKRLDWSLNYYADQVEQRHWYGFWDYGDIMHTYDEFRHVWRYDVGGFAWDNSELSSDMWLWFMFLRSGDPTAFRMAEAMNRHNRDVDIYHLGRFAGFGSRHNVMHWGCSAKQLRISTCMNRRFHYFLTTDERTGDVLKEVTEADRMLDALNPLRKLPGEPIKGECIMSVGTDYGAIASNWFTAWERTGDPKYREWLEGSMRDIGGSELGFFNLTFKYDPETKKLTPAEGVEPRASHLSVMFGLPTICSEMIQNFDVPEFEAAWLRYCQLIGASEEVLEKELGPNFKRPPFPDAHCRIVAYAAAQTDDEELAATAAQTFVDVQWKNRMPVLSTERYEGPDVLNPIDEARWVTTNGTSQWGLAAIQVSALIPEALSSAK